MSGNACSDINYIRKAAAAWRRSRTLAFMWGGLQTRPAEIRAVGLFNCAALHAGRPWRAAPHEGKSTSMRRLSQRIGTRFYALPNALRTLSGVAGGSTHLPIALWMAMMTRCVFARE